MLHMHTPTTAWPSKQAPTGARRAQCAHHSSLPTQGCTWTRAEHGYTQQLSLTRKPALTPFTLCLAAVPHAAPPNRAVRLLCYSLRRADSLPGHGVRHCGNQEPQPCGGWARGLYTALAKGGCCHMSCSYQPSPFSSCTAVYHRTPMMMEVASWTTRSTSCSTPCTC